MQTIGIIVAGGKSRRMGRDKATILFDGKPLLEHALSVLEGLKPEQILILGRPGHLLGLADPRPGEGPAANLKAWINKQSLPFRLLVLPVDMPLLNGTHLSLLINNPRGAYFNDLYLPLFATISSPVAEPVIRMKDLLQALDLEAISVPKGWKQTLINVNTPSDLKQLISG